MVVSFQLPQELERNLQTDSCDFSAEAKEAFLVALYRRGRLSHLALSQALGLGRLETEEVLRKHNVTEDLGTVEEYLQDAQKLEELRNSKR
jgi:hypothetical protein